MERNVIFKKATLISSILAGIMLASTGTTSQASLPDVKAFRGAEEVPDSLLGEMRGRYVSANKVMFFGVKMETRWKSAHESVRANLNMGFDLSRSSRHFRPHITMSYDIETEDHDDHHEIPSTGVVSGARLDKVSGIVQNIQVAGNTNLADNLTKLEIEDYDESEHDSSKYGAVLSGPASVSMQSGNDTSISLQVNPEKIGFEIDVPEQGAVKQEIRGGNMSSARGALQSIQLSGNRNSVLNSMSLTVAMDRIQRNKMNDIGGMLQALRGLHQTGSF